VRNNVTKDNNEKKYNYQCGESFSSVEEEEEEELNEHIHKAH
jgi:hypothetical protein